MNSDNYADTVVETSTRVAILEERFDRHLLEIKNEVKVEAKNLMAEIKEISKALRDHENHESQKHFQMNDRVSKLESERGFLAKALQAILASVTGGLAGWLSKHS